MNCGKYVMEIGWPALRARCPEAFVTIASLVIGELSSAIAFGADLVAEPRIERVAVYPQGAAITRLGTLDIPIGEHRLIVRGLPSSINEDALHVAIGSKDVRLGEVELRRITHADYVVEAERGAGGLQLYRDGAFVGAANTAGLLPGADVRLPFGADDRIRIESHDEPAQSGTRGILGGQMVEEHRRDFDVISFHGAPIVLELIDRIPVSQNADIKVDTLKDATPATTRDLDGKTGILLWKLRLMPSQRTTVRQHYSVGYPKGDRVAQTEGAGS
jgi:Domain of unknown function (DUF4139)/N-terminal domain of unknown function (DUF4140)